MEVTEKKKRSEIIIMYIFVLSSMCRTLRSVIQNFISIALLLLMMWEYIFIHSTGHCFSGV